MYASASKQDPSWTAPVVGGGLRSPFSGMVAGFRGMGPLAVGWAVGLVAGLVVLTGSTGEGHRSVLLVAAWHTALNLTPSATEATGAVAGHGQQPARDRLGGVDPPAGTGQSASRRRSPGAGITRKIYLA